MNEFSWLDFGSGVAETAIGAALGFGLGLIAFHFQHKKEREVEADEVREAGIDALNRLLQSAVLNIEALANAKRQLIDGLEPEARAMHAEMINFYKLDASPNEENIVRLQQLSASLGCFFQTFPEVTVMAAPDFREFSMFSHEMPALTTFVHRAMSNLQDLNARLKERNDLISQHSAENTVDGMGPARFIYFSSMLTGFAVYICDAVQFILAFLKLILDQLNEYREAFAKTGRFLSYELLPQAEAALPKEEPFPALRAQIVKFERRVAKAPVPRPPLGY